jgi:hypothetical protein
LKVLAARLKFYSGTVSFLKTLSAAETLVFSTEAG